MMEADSEEHVRDENSDSVDSSSQPQEVVVGHTENSEAPNDRSIHAPLASHPPDSSQTQSHDNQHGRINGALPASEPATALPSMDSVLKDHALASVSEAHASQHLQDAEGPHDFAFGKADRQPLSLGGKRGSIRHFVPTGNRHMPTEPHSNGKSFPNAIVQHHVDEQQDKRACLSAGSDPSDNSSSNGDQAIFMGEKAPSSVKDASSRHGLISHRALGPSDFPPGPKQKITSAGLAVHNVKRASNRPTVPDPQGTRHSATQSTFHRPPNVTASPGVTDDTAELLEVVAYKFRQKEQSLRTIFSADQNRMQAELARIEHENQMLHAQLAAVQETCDQSEVAIAKYKSQIIKAKGLQKFLDGLGSDFQGLKRSYDTERSKFMARLELSEAEVMRLESALAAKNEYEDMLTHAKTSLEKLLEAKGFELQAVIQHRDMIQAQLEERVGQLVEERDNRSRLEHLLNELRGHERISLAAAVSRCTEMVSLKLQDLGQVDDQVLLGLSEIHRAVENLSARPWTTPLDFSSLKAQLRETELRISQSLNIEATTNTTLADLSTSVASIFQHSMQPLRQQLDHLEGVSERALSETGQHGLLQEQLRASTDRVKGLEAQLDSIKATEINLNHALVQSAARVKELEATSARVLRPDEDAMSPPDVENKVHKTTAIMLSFTDTFADQRSSRRSQTAIDGNCQSLRRPRKGTLYQRPEESCG